MSESFKTSVRVTGLQQVDEFHALCALFGRRPHELAADMVLAGIRGYREDLDVAARVEHLVAAARGYQLRDGQTGVRLGNVIDLAARRRR